MLAVHRARPLCVSAEDAGAGHEAGRRSDDGTSTGADITDETGVEAALAAMPEVEDCWRVAGSEGYVLKVRVTDIPALEAAINALNRIEGVARTLVPGLLSLA